MHFNSRMSQLNQVSEYTQRNIANISQFYFHLILMNYMHLPK